MTDAWTVVQSPCSLVQASSTGRVCAHVGAKIVSFPRAMVSEITLGYGKVMGHG
jgi:hypothetical protein